MNLQAEKLKLIRAVLDIEDMSLLKEIKCLLKTKKEEQSPDWFDDLTEEQRQSVDRGLAQADRGERIPHEEALKRLGLSVNS